MRASRAQGERVEEVSAAKTFSGGDEFLRAEVAGAGGVVRDIQRQSRTNRRPPRRRGRTDCKSVSNLVGEGHISPL